MSGQSIFVRADSGKGHSTGFYSVVHRTPDGVSIRTICPFGAIAIVEEEFIIEEEVDE